MTASAFGNDRKENPNQNTRKGRGKMLKSVRSYQVIAVALISWVFVGQSSADGKTPAIWGELEPGPYAVGFKTIEKYDHSRVSRPEHDYFGRPLDGERARPIQTCIWYPAETTTELSSMVYGEYVFPYPGDSRFFGFLSEVQGREIQSLHRLLNNNRGGVLDLLSLKVGAIRDAPLSEGSFPLIVYSPELGSGVAENLILCEYLASRGFMVAATHSVGMTDLNPLFNQRDLETIIRDMEYIIAITRDLPHVDVNRLGIMGFGTGGSAALLLQMRNGDVDAVASLDASYISANHLEQARQNPYYDIQRMTSPLLQIYSGEMESVDLSLVDSFEYSQRYSLKFNRLNHSDLTSYGRLSSMILREETQPQAKAGTSYDDVCIYIFNFFNAHLNENSDSREFVNTYGKKKGIDESSIEFGFQPADELPPTRAQFMGIIGNNGVAKAEEIYEKFKDSGQVFFEEAVFNAIGYQLLQRGNFDNAIRIFKMNTDAYPLSANTWESLAEACEASGQNEQAIKYFKKTLEVLPGDTTNPEEFKEAIKNYAEEGLQRLEG
jgi:dienelactone hydrolase